MPFVRYLVQEAGVVDKSWEKIDFSSKVPKSTEVRVKHCKNLVAATNLKKFKPFLMFVD